MTYARPGVYLTETLLPAPIGQGPSANAAGAVAAPFGQGPEAVTYVNSWYQFSSLFGGYDAAYPATFGVAQFFSNGGRELYVKRILHSDASAASATIVTSGSDTVATITATNRGAQGNNLSVTLTAGTVSGTYTISVYNEVGSNSVLVEQYQNIVFTPSTDSSYAPTVINTVSSYIKVSNCASGTPVLESYPLSSGSNGTAVTHTDYTSYASTSASVWNEFSTIDRDFVMFTPNIWQSLGSSQAAVIEDAISWAEANNSFFVVETNSGLTPDQAIEFAQTSGINGNSNAAVYYPNLYISDPLGRSPQALRLVGPSGAVAGLYLTTDATRGVFKAPAGLSAALNGVITTERSFTSSDLDNLNTGIPSDGEGSAAPVNAIRQIPGSGIVVMGARTLLQDGTANRYVNMRRSLIYIEQTIKDLAQFALFENNDDILWSRLTSLITTFLRSYYNQGGLAGSSPAQAFYVLCNSTNNTTASIQNGIVNVQVGVALEYPAEFVVININQLTA
jgi:uncharacterized protein